MHSTTRCAVIGAGIAGLTCAYELKRGGLSVDVYERESTIGGRMGTRCKQHLAFDLGANFLVRAYTCLLQLADELGVAVRCASPVKQVVYRDGRFYRMNMSSMGDVLRLRGVHLWSRLELMAYVLRLRLKHPRALNFFDLSSTPEELNHEDAYSYARREISQEFADYIVDAFHSCMMFSRSTEASAAAFVALLSMMIDRDFDFSILHTVGDMQAIPDAIARQVPVSTGCAVTGLEPDAGGWKVHTAGSSQLYQHVILATTAGAAHSLLSRGPAAARALTCATRYAATINVSFRVPRNALGRVHCFYVPYVENQVVSEFTNESLKGETTTHEGWSLVNVGLHESAARGLIDSSDGKVFELVKKELVSLEPGLRLAEPYDIQRWPEAIPRYDCAQVARVRSFQAAGQGERGLYLCGDYLNAPWIEGASRIGHKVARSILQSGKSADAGKRKQGIRPDA